jgi:hypothetical protein
MKLQRMGHPDWWGDWLLRFFTARGNDKSKKQQQRQKQQKKQIPPLRCGMTKFG